MNQTYDVSKQPGHLARRFRQIATAVQMEEYEKFGVTPLQFGVMLVLRKSPGIDQVTLSGMLSHNQANIGGVVARLCQRGLVTRKRNNSDKRSWVLFLAAEGDTLVNTLNQGVKSAQDRILEPLTNVEKKRFMTLLTKIVYGNEATSRSTITLKKKPSKRARITSRL